MFVCVCVCLSKQLSKCFQSLPSFSEAVKTFPVLGARGPGIHTHAEMHLNQPIRSSRGSLITKTGSLPCPNDGVLTCKHTNARTNTSEILVWLQTHETLIHSVHTVAYTPPLPETHTQTQFKHTRGPQTHYGSTDQKE